MRSPIPIVQSIHGRLPSGSDTFEDVLDRETRCSTSEMLGLRMTRLVFVSLLWMLMGCATEPAKIGELAQPTDEGALPFHMVLSNQSFKDDCVFIDVSIDGTHIIEGNFDVEDQHTLHKFEFFILPGDHTLEAQSDTGVTLERSFTISEETWIALFYWAYESGVAPSEFSFSAQNFPVSID